ncbi:MULTISPECIES: hypothetical protein [Streptomyces]|uniref:Tail terminator n=2 Tax=Streptomyces TaxID=1883 RepID=A0A1D8G4X0_9ACTN|nr:MULTISPECIES: hypothetical protein [Streptomyces]AOT60463.1 hypothetical protein A4G23_03338 [Streptomyces rubrolavendulae]OSY49707.1 hypothetical protein BG846_04670 [Streptomyces fradiae ATCC 10745 = DSM 40063]QEV13583.1 hypothetical protein CP974_18100 [Streptomyces fradiae ATCC 10745 = DSM 40063]UQS31172.1 hypothetical protein J5J01_05650 [Streptomyces fradiae]
MSSAPSTFPDVEAIVVDLLSDRPELAGAIVDESPPPGFDGTQRAVIVSRRGGAWVDDLHVDRPMIELEVYGPDKTAAHVLANAARAVLLRCAGTVLGTSVITDAAEADGPRWLPDYVYTAANRYLCVIQLSVRTS